jgi:hypothetical protein
LQADRENKKNEPEFANELEDFGADVPADVAEEEAGEKHAGNPEADAANLNGREGESGYRDDGEDKDGCGDFISGREL